MVLNYTRKMKKIDNYVKVCFMTAFEIYYDEFRRLFPKLSLSGFAHKTISIDALSKLRYEELKTTATYFYIFIHCIFLYIQIIFVRLVNYSDRRFDIKDALSELLGSAGILLVILFAVYCFTTLSKSLANGLILYSMLFIPLKTLETNTSHPCPIIDRITTVSMTHVSNPM